MASQTMPAERNKRVTVSCRICSSDDHETYLKAQGYRIVRCTACGLWFVNPQPAMEELRRFYERYDDGEQWRSGEEQFNCGIRTAIQRFKRPGAVLDIGSGSGNFLRGMREAGYSVFGIEPSHTGSGHAQSVQGISVFTGTIEDYLAANPRRRFDVVTLLNVLEHLAEPKRTLLQLRRLMARDAVLAVVVPDARFHALLGSIRRLLRLSDPYWLERPQSVLSGFKLPDHLCSFQPRTISLLLQRCGFEIASVQNAPIVGNPQIYRNVGKWLVRSVFDALYYLTWRRVLFGYSTLVLARIRPEDHAPS